MLYPPTASPNAVLEVQRLEVLLEAEQEKGRIREDLINVLKGDKEYLQGELVKKDELIKELLAKDDCAGSSSTIQSEKSEKGEYGNLIAPYSPIPATKIS